MQIYVKTLTGVTETIDCEPIDTIDDIKKKIDKVIGLPPD